MNSWTFLHLFCQVLIGFYLNVAAGIEDVLPFPVNSTILCNASNCTVSCKDGYVFYDGNLTKKYSCDRYGTWSPYVPSVGCLDENKTVFIGIGTGFGGLLLILLIVLALIKSSKKTTASNRNKYKDSTGKIIQEEGKDIHDIECDELKDNLLYISSEQPVKEEKEKDEGISTTVVDDGLQDNILYISSDQLVEVKKEQHKDFTTKVVDDGLKDNLLYISSDQPINKDISKAVHNKKDQNKYSTTASKVNESNLQPTSTSLKSNFKIKHFIYQMKPLQTNTTAIRMQ